MEHAQPSEHNEAVHREHMELPLSFRARNLGADAEQYLGNRLTLGMRTRLVGRKAIAYFVTDVAPYWSGASGYVLPPNNPDVETEPHSNAL